MRTHFVLALGLFASCCHADPIAFPSNYVPFTSLDYRTVPDASGYSLVVGEVATLTGIMQLVQYLRSLPPVSGHQQYTNEPIELAPGLFFNNVLVPTSAEVEGNFQDFGGPIYNPSAFSSSGPGTQFAVNYSLPPGLYSPFPGNIIPQSVFGGLFAFRLGPADPASIAPEPGSLLSVALGIVLVMMRLRPGRRS